MSFPVTDSPFPRRRRARRGQGEQLREEILVAAERLLLQTGDQAAVSIRAIADAVGCTPPSIYLHFADKVQLMLAICERHYRELGAAMVAAAGEADDPVFALRRLGHAYIDFGLEHPEHYRIMFMTRIEDTSPGAKERMLAAAAFGTLLAIVERGISAGALRPLDPLLIASSLWVAVHGVTSLLLTIPEPPWPDADTLIDAVLDMCLEGFSAAPRG